MVAPTETRTVEGVQPVAPRQVSRTKTSSVVLVSNATKLLAPELKATKRPSLLMPLPKLLPLAWVPSLATETRTVEGVQPVALRQVSRTKMFEAALVSPATRSLAPDSKATKRPSGLIEKLEPPPPAWVPSLATETRTVEGVQPVAPRQVLRTKMSEAALVSPATRLLASDWKATKRPSALTAALLALPKLLPLAWVPSLATETRTVEGVQPVAPRQVSRTKTSPKALVSPATRLLAKELKATK